MTEVSLAPEVIPPFEAGLQILKTENFRLVYDHPHGWEKEKLQRIYLEPLNKKAENTLVHFSRTTGRNLLANRHLDTEAKKPKTVKALKFNDQPEELIKALIGNTHKTSSRFGYKIPSLQLLEAELITNPALKTSQEVLLEHVYPTSAYSFMAIFTGVIGTLYTVLPATQLESGDAFLKTLSISLLPVGLIHLIAAGYYANEARQYISKKKALRF